MKKWAPQRIDCIVLIHISFLQRSCWHLIHAFMNNNMCSNPSTVKVKLLNFWLFIVLRQNVYLEKTELALVRSSFQDCEKWNKTWPQSSPWIFCIKSFLLISCSMLFLSDAVFDPGSAAKVNFLLLSECAHYFRLTDSQYFLPHYTLGEKN